MNIIVINRETGIIMNYINPVWSITPFKEFNMLNRNILGIVETKKNCIMVTSYIFAYILDFKNDQIKEKFLEETIKGKKESIILYDDEVAVYFLIQSI